MHGDRDYLDFLQESTFKNRSFVSKDAETVIEITEDELREEIESMFEDENDFDALLMLEVDYAGLVSKYGGEIGSKAVSQAHQSGMAHGAGAAAIVAAVAAAGIAAYKRFYSKAAKACAGMPTREKTQCMQKHKANAIKAKISALESGKSKCDQAKNPEGCKNKIHFKLKAEKAKLGSD